MAVTIEADKARLKKVAAAWNKGVPQAQIARDMDITRQRVGQMLAQCGRYKIPIISFEEFIEARHKSWSRNT